MFPKVESASPPPVPLPPEETEKQWPITSYKEKPSKMAENTSTGVNVPPPNGNLEVQMDLMKPQVDSISRLGNSAGVSTGQLDVLRKYISLKEAESKDLKEQLSQHQAMLKKLTGELQRATRAIQDRSGESEAVKSERDHFRKEFQELKDRHKGDVAQVRAELEERLRTTGKLDADVEAWYRQKEEWKEKIREDLKKIKLKEREIETKHELLKRDMQALLDSKDKHLLELRKKCDALEFEQEALEDRLRKSTFVLSSIDSKKKRLIETMRLAISLLEKVDSTDEYGGSDADPERKAG